MAVEIDCRGARIVARLTAAAVRELDLATGRPVYAIVKSAAFDPAGIGLMRPVVAI